MTPLVMTMSPDREYHETYRLDLIRIGGDTHARARLDSETVRDYAEAIEAGATLPPVLVFHDGSAYWLADGFHRWHAHDRAGRLVIRCLVRKGSQADAKWAAIAANQTHGLRRSNADKAEAVRRALRHPAAAELSNVQIAEHVGVSDELVRRLRKAMEEAGSLPTVGSRLGRDGRTIDTSRIGRAIVKEPSAGDAETGGQDLADDAGGGGDAKPAVCPNCGGSDFYEDGDCRQCLEPCGHLVGHAEPAEDVPGPDDPAGSLWREVEGLVSSWVTDHPEDRAVAAARLENMADMIRSGIVFG